MLALDLGVFRRRPHVISTKEAMGWFGLWTGLVLRFNVGILFFHERDRQAGLELSTGFLFQRTESLDLIPFRRLLLIENIIDRGDLKVRDAMRRRSGIPPASDLRALKRNQRRMGNRKNLPQHG